MQWGQRPCERPALAEEPPRLPCFHSISFCFQLARDVRNCFVSFDLHRPSKCNGLSGLGAWPACDIPLSEQQSLFASGDACSADLLEAEEPHATCRGRGSLYTACICIL